MKAISTWPEERTPESKTKTGQAEKKSKWVWMQVGGGIIFLICALSACGFRDIPYDPNYTHSPAYSFSYNDLVIPSMLPMPTYPSVPPSSTTVLEFFDSLRPSSPAAAYEGLEILSVTSPVARDDYATLTARGKPGVEYNISVIYYSGPSKASGLYSKTADENGDVSWTWHVGPKTRAGEWKIIVSGGGEKDTTYFTVTK